MRLILVFCVGAIFAQTVDPISDKLRSDLLKAHRDQLAADKDRQAAMMTYNAAESRFEAAGHNLTIFVGDANRRCMAVGKTFDLDRATCVAK
jgi:hypothetical protein